MVGSLPDVIMYAKFQVEIFRGYDFTGGQISHFPIDFWMGLTTVQRDCAACDSLTAIFNNQMGQHCQFNPVDINCKSCNGCQLTRLSKTQARVHFIISL